MKGVIFNVFNQMIEEKFGEDMWEDLIDDVNPPSQGAYTSAGTYPDEELFAFVGALSKRSNIPVPDLVKAYGAYLAPQLAKIYPVFFENKTPKQFLQSIHDVIHVEVRKLYPDAGLPDIEYEDPGENQLVMIYTSPRQLCALAEGLIQGAMEHFSAAYDLQHPKCLHQGDPHCRLELTFN